MDWKIREAMRRAQQREAERAALRRPTRVQAGAPRWAQRAMAGELATKDMTRAT